MNKSSEEPVTAGEWTKTDPGLTGSMVPDIELKRLTQEEENQLAECESAYYFYKLFNSDTFLKKKNSSTIKAICCPKGKGEAFAIGHSRKYSLS